MLDLHQFFRQSLRAKIRGVIELGLSHFRVELLRRQLLAPPCYLSLPYEFFYSLYSYAFYRSVFQMLLQCHRVVVADRRRVVDRQLLVLRLLVHLHQLRHLDGKVRHLVVVYFHRFVVVEIPQGAPQNLGELNRGVVQTYQDVVHHLVVDHLADVDLELLDVVVVAALLCSRNQKDYFQHEVVAQLVVAVLQMDYFRHVVHLL
jgi:hypothetical protein